MHQNIKNTNIDSSSSNKIQYLYNEAQISAKNGNTQLLTQCAKNAIQQNFHGADYVLLNDFAVLLYSNEEDFLASKFFKKAAELEPSNKQVLYNTGRCFQSLNDFETAVEFFDKALAIDEDWIILHDKGRALLSLFKIDEAISYVNESLKLNPKAAIAYSSLAIAFEAKGDKEKAIEMIHKAIDLNESNGTFYYTLTTLKKFGEEDKSTIEKMESLLQDITVPDEAKIYLCFALGKAFADIKDHDKSFGYYRLANSKKHDEKKFNINHFVSSAKRYRNVFNQDLLKNKKNYGSKSSVPIFIVGMPRSGTTLTEQIISCHSKVHGAGEMKILDEIAGSIESIKIPGDFLAKPFPECMPFMKPDKISNLSKQYLAHLTKDIGLAKKVTNKLPANFQHLGFISLLFPNAHIIHCKRHPLDVFLSIYFQHFAYVYYSSDPSLIIGYYIIGYYKIYDQLMKYWHQQIPDKIYDSYYEELLLKQEEKSRDLISHCGLKWEQQCLNFHENRRSIHTASHAQVRQRLYKDSMFKWKKYEKFIEPAKEALKNEIAQYEEELAKRIGKLN